MDSKRWAIWPEGFPHDFLGQFVSGRGIEARRGTGVPVSHDELGSTSTYF